MVFARRLHHETPDWRYYFAGAWKMARHIGDARNGKTGAAQGEAKFAANTGNAHTLTICSETLTIDFGGRQWRAGQSTIWWFYEQNGPRLYFQDGRYFCHMLFSWDANAWRAIFSHFCGADRYEGVTHIIDDNAWRLVWRVTGPRKDYVLETDYRRV